MVIYCAQVMAVTLFQCGMAYAVRNCSWGAIFALGWLVSGFCNQNLFCAQHELSHFLAFKKPLHNKIISIVSNCPLVVPTATTFRKYHQEHHSHLVSCPHTLLLAARLLAEVQPWLAARMLRVVASGIHAGTLVAEHKLIKGSMICCCDRTLPP